MKMGDDKNIGEDESEEDIGLDALDDDEED